MDIFNFMYKKQFHISVKVSATKSQSSISSASHPHYHLYKADKLATFMMSTRIPENFKYIYKAIMTR